MGGIFWSFGMKIPILHVWTDPNFDSYSGSNVPTGPASFVRSAHPVESGDVHQKTCGSCLQIAAAIAAAVDSSTHCQSSTHRGLKCHWHGKEQEWRWSAENGAECFWDIWGYTLGTAGVESHEGFFFTVDLVPSFLQPGKICQLTRMWLGWNHSTSIDTESFIGESAHVWF
jgi:hypothetical protein